MLNNQQKIEYCCQVYLIQPQPKICEEIIYFTCAVFVELL